MKNSLFAYGLTIGDLRKAQEVLNNEGLGEYLTQFTTEEDNMPVALLNQQDFSFYTACADEDIAEYLEEFDYEPSAENVNVLKKHSPFAYYINKYAEVDIADAISHAINHLDEGYSLTSLTEEE